MTRLVFLPAGARGELLGLAGCFLMGAAVGVLAQAAEELSRQRREDRAALKAAGAQLEELDERNRELEQRQRKLELRNLELAVRNRRASEDDEDPINWPHPSDDAEPEAMGD